MKGDRAKLELDDPPGTQINGVALKQDKSSREEQRQAYIQGEWGNPLTTRPTGGRILSALQQPFFTLRPPRGFGVLTTTGRKSGKKRRKCVRAVRKGDRVYLVSLRGRYGDWFRNIEASPSMSLRIRGGTFDGLAREITDSPEYEMSKAAYCDTVNWFDRLEYRAHRRDVPLLNGSANSTRSGSRSAYRS